MEDLNNWQDNFEECCYAKKLLDKIAYLNGVSETEAIDIIEVEKAIHYAKKYHGSQMRQSGEPFYSHPIEVAYMIDDYLFRTDIIITAILHDTLEDTELTKSQIAEIFSVQIANQVYDLTRIKENGVKITSAEMVELLYKEKKYDILLIKIFDRLHNIQTISAKSPTKIKKTIAETIKRFITLSIYLDGRIHRALKIEEIITELCYKNLSIEQYIVKEVELR